MRRGVMGSGGSGRADAPASVAHVLYLVASHAEQGDHGAGETACQAGSRVAMGERAKITVARFASGVVIRVEGAGTMGESAVLNAFAEEVLRDRGQRIIV